MNINSAPVSQAELLPTIMSALGLEGEKYGGEFLYPGVKYRFNIKAG